MKIFKKLKIEIRFLLSLLSILVCTNSYSQTSNTITGTVLSDTDGEPIIGATAFAKETNTGTITDLDGKFILSKANKIKTVRISCIGYVTQNVQVKPGQQILVRLKEDIKLIDEVVVVGYGTQKKKEVIGSVASVNSSDITKTSTSDLGSALQGLVSGVNVQASSGEPGSAANIQIRGIGSVNGDNTPFYVVDGIPYDGVPVLSSNEIARVDILKDAASASIYGTRASNGVILITTKTGEAGKMKVSFNAYYGIQKIMNPDLNLANTRDNTYFSYMQKMEDPSSQGKAEWLPIVYNTSSLNQSYDILQRMMVDNAPIQEYSSSFSGGSKEFTYNLTTSYFKQDGAMLRSGYDKGAARLNTSFTRGKFNLTTALSGNIAKKQIFPGNFVTYALTIKPYQYIPLDGSADIYTSDENNTGNIGHMAQRLAQKNTQEANGFTGSIQMRLDLFPGLKATARLATFVNNTLQETYTPKINVYKQDGSINTSSVKLRSSVFNRNTKNIKYSMEYALNYIKKFGNHNINALANFSYEKTTAKMFSAQKSDLVSNDSPVLDAGTMDAIVAGNKNIDALLGFLGRVQYDYKNRYLFSLSSRLDGSSRFSSSNRWGLFPSAMIGWNVSDEKFFKPLSKVVTKMKLRASYGTTGNNRFANYAFQNVMLGGYNYIFGTGGSEKYASGLIQKAYANSDVKWETSISKNIGLDMSFFNNQLTLTVDAYNATKSDMLFNVTVPPSAVGQNSNVVLNVGDMKNSGFEVETSYKWVHKKHSLQISANYSRNVNEVTKTSDNTDMMYLGNVSGQTDQVVVIKKGYEAGSFFLVETNGVVDTPEKLKEYSKIDGQAHMGSLIYKDKNGNGVIDNGDRVYKGSGSPKWESGFNVSYSYKNFDFSAQLYGSFGGKIINATKATAYQNGMHQDLVYSWSRNNVTSRIPLGYSKTDNSYRIWSDYFLEDGDFVRLRSVILGYSLPKRINGLLGLTNLRFYLAAQNILTFTKYTGFDPEVGNNGFSNKGIDAGYYPICGQYRLGVQFAF